MVEGRSLLLAFGHQKKAVLAGGNQMEEGRKIVQERRTRQGRENSLNAMILAQITTLV
jgi:hypothetical protein